MRNKGPQSLADLLPDAMSAFRVRANPELDRIWDVWDAAAGEVAAKNAQPGVIRNGVLLVRVTSAPWCQELQYRKQQILSRLNGELGEDLVSDIRFKVGLLE
ncbi:MAG: DUF721 domain-containing protein [Desulfatibacillaceae bacterium]